MNCNYLISQLHINTKLIDPKKQQTTYKIKYITEYVKRWLLVNVNRPDVTDINFIDCMCNAGIYQDGDLCTSMEVLILFIDSAQLHPAKRFHLFLNDNNTVRVNSCCQIAEQLIEGKSISNLKIYRDNIDVNDYLANFKLFDTRIKYGASTVLFVDPYDFGTVKIARLTSFIMKYYCEVIFNFFISDYVRNGIDKRIRECIGNVEINNKEELVRYIVGCLNTGYINYVFSYQFKTSTNTELYQIIYATPHIRGLQVLKEALWKTFNGRFFHRNADADMGQLSLFTEVDDKKLLLSIHACEAKKLLLQRFGGQTVSYKSIETFLTGNTMMQTTDFLGSVLKPLIAEGMVFKKNVVKNRANYTDDEYVIKRETQS